MGIKIKLLIVCLLSVFVLNAQPPVQSIGTTNNRVQVRGQMKVDSALGLPNSKQTSNLMNGNIVYNSLIKGLEYYDVTTARWYALSPTLILDGIINGGTVSWTGSGLSFYISEANYVIGGTLYHSNDTTITLSAADPTNPRIDLLVLNTAGVDTLKGTPSVDPAQPQATPGTELELTSILINAGATTPSGITQTIIWDENTESVAAATMFSTFTINANNTSNPFHLTKAIDVSSHSFGGSILFTLNSPATLTDYSVLVFHVRLKSSYTSNPVFYLTWSRSTGGPVSNAIPIRNGDYGFSSTLTGAYQTIQIPISAFAFTSAPENMDQFVISIPYTGLGMYIDYVRLQGGIPTSTSGVISFNSRTGNVSPLKADYSRWFLDSTYKRNDSIFGMKNGASYFQFKDSTGSGSGLSDGDKGDLTVSGSGLVWTLNNGVIGNTKLADMPAHTFKGNNTALLDLPLNLTIAEMQAELKLPPDSSVSINNRIDSNYKSAVQIDDTSYALVRGNGTRDTFSFSIAGDLINYVTRTELADSTAAIRGDFPTGGGGGTTNADSTAARIRRGTFAQRPSAPDTGQVYWQTDRLAGKWEYDGTKWLFVGSPSRYEFYENFSGTTAASFPKIFGLTFGTGASFTSVKSVGYTSYGTSTTGTTSTGYSSYGFKEYATDPLILDSTIQWKEARVRIPVLGDVTNNFDFAFGWLGHQSLWGFMTLGFFYNYNNNSGMFETRTRKYDASANMTNKNTGITVTAGQWYKLAIEVNGYANTINFYIDDVLVTTHSGSDFIPLPNNTLSGSYNFGISKSAGTTARTFDIDYYLQYIIKAKYE